MNTKEQKRAGYALREIAVFGQDIAKEDANFLVGLPTMILTNGLAQTLAFLLSKKPDQAANINTDKHIRSFRLVRKWLVDPREGVGELKGKTLDDKAFLLQLAQMSQENYITAQQETLSLLQWVKRYARAFQRPQ